MIYLCKVNECGYVNYGWLDFWYIFFFVNYYDLNFMGFFVLCVINDDVIEVGQGFGIYLYKDMEILIYVLEGIVEYQDSMGNKEQVLVGEFQIMSVGMGICYLEYNLSSIECLYLYQIWIMFEENGIMLCYEQCCFDVVQGKQLVFLLDV